jgi:hypothetical protein
MVPSPLNCCSSREYLSIDFSACAQGVKMTPNSQNIVYTIQPGHQPIAPWN